MSRQYPDISDILAQKARGRLERSRLSFTEKLDILEKLRNQVKPIIQTRRKRSIQMQSSGVVTTSVSEPVGRLERYSSMPVREHVVGTRAASPRGDGRPTIRMIPYPTSTSIKAVGYSASHQVMRIRYIEGRAYDYNNVPPAVYEGFLKAASKGQFVNWEIKPNFDYQETD
jgi:hypothetical protein